MRYLFILLLIVAFVSRSQELYNMTHPFKIGATEIGIYEENWNDSAAIVFLNVHEDEATSLETLFQFSKTDQLPFFYLKHQKTRRILFEFEGEKFDFDPNRIYTKKGRKKTLKDGANYNRKARKEVANLAEEVIKRIENAKLVVALHNNTDVNYSINSYAPNGDEAKNTKALFVNPAMDADDFIYTTDSDYFELFKKEGINVILQDNEKYVNDGSLSVYCGEKGIPYVNIETQKGHFDAQVTLLRTLLVKNPIRK